MLSLGSNEGYRRLYAPYTYSYTEYYMPKHTIVQRLTDGLCRCKTCKDLEKDLSTLRVDSYIYDQTGGRAELSLQYAETIDTPGFMAAMYMSSVAPMKWKIEIKSYHNEDYRHIAKTLMRLGVQKMDQKRLNQVNEKIKKVQEKLTENHKALEAHEARVAARKERLADELAAAQERVRKANEKLEELLEKIDNIQTEMPVPGKVTMAQDRLETELAELERDKVFLEAGLKAIQEHEAKILEQEEGGQE